MPYFYRLKFAILLEDLIPTLDIEEAIDEDGT